ncbi:unnamed protein product [Penicillium salamii]|nr:unnamed protein product [Penicillium salamii]CAG8287427.1 unnamed protein product [Penicillium salamii]
MFLPHPNDLDSPVVYFKVGPNEKEFSVHVNVLKDRLASFCSTLDLPNCVIGFHDDIEDIFGYVLQFLYCGDYHISLLADESGHIAHEDGTTITSDRLLPLRGNYFQTCATTQRFLDHPVESFAQTPILPISGEAKTICQSFDALLIHARLHIFAKNHGIGTLHHLSLWKLVHALEHLELDSCRTEGVVKLLLLVSDLMEKGDTLYTVMAHYAASRSRLLVRCPHFASLMLKRPELNYSILSNICASL